MTTSGKRITRQSAILAASAFAYFLVFPGDLNSVAATLEEYLKIVASFLELTSAVAPAVYAVGGTLVLGWVTNNVTRQILASRAQRGQQGERGGAVS